MLLEGAHGPLLDLGGSVSPVAHGSWGGSRQLEATSLGLRPDPTRELEDLVDQQGPGAFGDFLSVMVTPHVADLPRLFRAIAALLDEDGHYLFVEPDAVATPWATAAGRGVEALSGLRLARDITGVMWDSGLSVARIDRKPVSMTVWPLRSLVSGVARRAPLDDMEFRRT